MPDGNHRRTGNQNLMEGLGHQTGQGSHHGQQVSHPPLSKSKIDEAVAFNKKVKYSRQLWMKIQGQAKTAQDGAPGKNTATMIAQYQKLHNIDVSGKAEEATMKDMKLFKYIGKIPEEFDTLWKNHPHNYQSDASQNTSSADLRKEQGFPDYVDNTCASRVSTMFNKMGGIYKISRKKAAKAGIKRERVLYSKKTKNYYILSAKEMWTYVDFWFGNPNAQFPKTGKYKDVDDFESGWTKEIEPVVSKKKGIVAFKKIFGYSGTGHIDIFNGVNLSDAPNWYPSKQIALWFA